MSRIPSPEISNQPAEVCQPFRTLAYIYQRGVYKPTHYGWKSCYAVGVVYVDSMSEISPEVVAERLEQGDSDLVLLDIRHTNAFEEWHIPGSEHVDVYDELKSDPRSATDALGNLPRDAEIVTVCGVGKISAIATDLLEEMGYEAKTLVDGMRGWSRVHRTATIPIDTGELIQVARPGTGCLSYVLVSNGGAVIVDPS